MKNKNKKKKMMSRSTDETKTTKNLPFDLIIEVLSRLPVKSLVRFQCVSKEWSALLSPSSSSTSSSFFKNRYNMEQGSKKKSLLLSWNIVEAHGDKFLRLQVTYMMQRNKEGDLCSEIIRIPSPYPDKTNVSTSSCHGLVCFSRRLSEDAYVLNPSTRDMVKLPPRFRAGECYNTSIGIGFLPSRNQFKIVSWYPLGSLALGTGCDILTLTTANATENSMWTWRKSCRIPYFSTWTSISFSICINGVMYWWFSDGEVLEFDLEREEATRRIPFGTQCVDPPPFLAFMELGGSLRIAETYWRQTTELVTNIWKFVREEIDEEGTKFNKLIGLGPEIIYHWHRQFNIVHETIPIPSSQQVEKLFKLLNTESEKIQYLYVQKYNKAVIKKYGDHHWEMSDLELITVDHNTFFVSESLFSLTK